MKTQLAPFDISTYLNSPKMIRACLRECLKDENPRVFLAALGHAAKAVGMTEIARKTGLGRESLYKALTAESHPQYETVHAVMLAVSAHDKKGKRANRRAKAKGHVPAEHPRVAA